MQKDKITAYALHICRSLIYGSSFLFTGHLLRSVEVLDVLALRFLLSAAVMTLLSAVGVLKMSLDKEKIKALLPVAFFEPVAYFLFETFGLTGISTSLAGLLGAMSPVVIVILETLVLKERTTLLQKIFLGVAMVGVALIGILSAAPGGQDTVWGILLFLGAPISGGCFVIFSRKGSKRRCTALETTYFCAISGAVVFNAINVIRHLCNHSLTTYFQPLADPQNLFGFFFLAVMSSVVATVFQNFALSKVQASSLSGLSGVSTITSVLLGVLVNHEQLHWYHLLGGLCVLIGALGINYLSAKKIETA